jgi:ribosome biogenesis GTPase A
MPAVTKQQSRHQLNARMDLTDTPGLMWPKIRYASDGLMLAASHAIGENAYVEEEVAMFLGETLRDRYPELLTARYGFDPRKLDGAGVIEGIAARRGLRSRGGATDFLRASLIFLQDYRSGALGRISLESPQSRKAMMASSAMLPGDEAGADDPEPTAT